MKHGLVFFTTLLILVLLSTGVVVDGKNCRKYRCIPTPTPTAQAHIVFYPAWNVQGVSTTSGWVCRMHGSQTWFACQPYSVRLPSGQTLYGFIRG